MERPIYSSQLQAFQPRPKALSNSYSSCVTSVRRARLNDTALESADQIEVHARGVGHQDKPAFTRRTELDYRSAP